MRYYKRRHRVGYNLHASTFKKKIKPLIFVLKNQDVTTSLLEALSRGLSYALEKKKRRHSLTLLLPPAPTYARPALEGKIIIAEKGRGRGSYILLSLHPGSEKHSEGVMPSFHWQKQKRLGFFLGKPCVGSWHVSLSRAYSCGV